MPTSDVVRPKLLSLGLERATLDIDHGETTLTILAHFTDNLSGIFDGIYADGSGGSPPQIRFVSESGQSVDAVFDILHPVSGDRLDGIYQATITLGAFAELGTWSATSLLLSDEAGNVRTFGKKSAFISQTKFTVINANSDVAVPTLKSLELDHSSLNIDNGEKTLIVTAQFTDAVSGIFDGIYADDSGGSPPQIRFTSPSGQTVTGLFDILNPQSGDRHDGVYLASIKLGDFSEAGTWRVEYLLLGDEAGNSTSLKPAQSTLLASSNFEVVNSNSDVLAPVLQSIEIGTPSTDPISGQSTILVTAHLGDDVSGLFDGVYADGSGGSPPQIRFVSSTGQIVTGLFDIELPVSGDRLDGVFQAKLILGSFAEAGTWKVDYLLLNDEAGNLQSLNPGNSPMLFAGNFVLGSDGEDDLAGTQQSDLIYGYDGDDHCVSGKGDDLINGGVGHDVLTGGLGKDILTGGSGEADAMAFSAEALVGPPIGDIFDFNSVKDSAKGAKRDVITDFSSAEHDVIDVSGIDANSHRPRNQKFKFIDDKAFHRKSGELHFVVKTGFVIVEGDVNGDGKADFQIEVRNVTALGSGDFAL